MLFGVKPNVTNLRVFGCLAYAYNFDLDRKAKKGIMVGYCSRSAAYLIYLPNQKKVVRSGHVSFNEHKLYYSDADLSKIDATELTDSMIVDPNDDTDTDTLLTNTRKRESSSQSVERVVSSRVQTYNNKTTTPVSNTPYYHSHHYFCLSHIRQDTRRT